MCGSSVMGLKWGHFPGTIDTDLGNSCPLHLERSISDEHGMFVSVCYRQAGGYEVSVFLD